MPATRIMLIRHAEKPDGDGGPGLMPDGTQNPEALTALGWARANALVGLFAPANEAAPRPPLARPASLFASESQSLRTKQTIAPLATALNLSVTTFLKGQEAQLVASAKADEGPALISWQHEAIPEIAALIRGRADGVPEVWPGHRFDLVWVFDLAGDGAWSFVQSPQLLIPGDSAKPIGRDG
jgi:broad specificity phosphatase PhoE